MIILIGRGHVELNSYLVCGFLFVNEFESRATGGGGAFKNNFA
jgi:hypothetical protein